MDNDVDFLIGKNKYGYYCVPKAAQHRPAATLALKGEVYEADTIQFILDNCGGRNIIHAGAFFGDFLPALGKTGNVVFAFEPVFDSFRCAEVTLALNFSSREMKPRLYNYGLGNHTEDRQIMYIDHLGDSLGGGALYNYSEAHAKPEQLQMTKIVRLDDVVVPENHQEEYADFSIIHLDVEGYEEKALMGARNIIKASKPILILESYSDTMFETMFFKQEIFGQGYKIESRLDNNVILVP